VLEKATIQKGHLGSTINIKVESNPTGFFFVETGMLLLQGLQSVSILETANMCSNNF